VRLVVVDVVAFVVLSIDHHRNRFIMSRSIQLALLCILTVTSWSTVTAAANILVVGSINADTFLPVSRLPSEGENLTLLPNKHPVVDVPGGKGCTQAVAASKLYQAGTVSFVGQFGNDAAAIILKQALTDARVDLLHSDSHDDLPSGRGYVFLSESGAVSAVVSGGSNTGGWKTWERAWEQSSKFPDSVVLEGTLDVLLQDCECIMLQREVPEYVNMLVANYAKRQGRNILVLQDVGGEDRPMDASMMQCCDYLLPNESELQRLVRSFGVPSKADDGGAGPLDSSTIVEMARVLQKHGARNVLVTRGSRGSTLVTESGDVLHQPAFGVSHVVDETGAGDCYRAAFAVALLEGKSLQQCMEFASAAGSCSVEREGAVPSTPTRDDVEERFVPMTESSPDSVLKIPRGDGLNLPRGGGAADFPFLIGSRLNSMKDRPELWDEPLPDPRDWVKRQSAIKGLTCVDFNYPQHFHTWTSQEAKACLDEFGLVAGAVCLRYPSKFARGAMNHPDSLLRQEAIDLTKQAAQVALDLGCKEVVVWSAYDGYDYPFQVEYDTKWLELVDAFRECCDAFPQIRFSLEYKPTDENTRFFTVPTTGAALLLVNEIDRPNMGLTLDVGHMLMSGENPGQSIAMVGRVGKLFGIQLNDGFTRLAAEDGLMFGSVHPTMALEIMYQLRKISFDGHVYFDTFPQRTDPIKEAEYNIRKVKGFWAASGAIDKKRLQQVMDEHDAVGALEIADEAFRQL
jgi:sugar/nucleoside kinase (ribokinase family)/sugar phosphate isomerase/epimerase